jgi:hypothetical protein
MCIQGLGHFFPLPPPSPLPPTPPLPSPPHPLNTRQKLFISKYFENTVFSTVPASLGFQIFFRFELASCSSLLSSHRP